MCVYHGKTIVLINKMNYNESNQDIVCLLVLSKRYCYGNGAPIYKYKWLLQPTFTLENLENEGVGKGE